MTREELVAEVKGLRLTAVADFEAAVGKALAYGESLRRSIAPAIGEVSCDEAWEAWKREMRALLVEDSPR